MSLADDIVAHVARMVAAAPPLAPETAKQLLPLIDPRNDEGRPARAPRVTATAPPAAKSSGGRRGAA
jgi:hypothetical protein